MSQQIQVAKQKNKNTRLARGLLWFAGIVNVALLLMMCAASSSDGAVAAIVMLGLGVDIAVAVLALHNGLLYELIIEHKWKKTCRGLGGNFVGEGRKQFYANPFWVFGGQFGEWKSRTIYPKLRDVRRTGTSSWTGMISPFYGQDVDDYNKQASRFALAFNAEFVGFDKTADGKLRIRVGEIPIPAQYEYDFQE